MSAFDATSLLNQLHANLASITTASMGKFTRSAYRFTLDKEPDAGPDGKYFIDIVGVLPYARKWGTGENIATAQVAIRVAYNRLGGDLGGGDRRVVQQNAASDSMLIADVCENPDNYNPSASGISIVVFQGFSRVQDIGKTEIWETRLDVTFRSDLHTTPVQDLMVASLITDSLTALSALNVLSFANGTGAVVTAQTPFSLYFLDRVNENNDAANGDDIVAATGVTGAVWRRTATTSAIVWNGSSGQHTLLATAPNGEVVDATVKTNQAFRPASSTDIIGMQVLARPVDLRVSGEAKVAMWIGQFGDTGPGEIPYCRTGDHTFIEMGTFQKLVPLVIESPYLYFDGVNNVVDTARVCSILMIHQGIGATGPINIGYSAMLYFDGAPDTQPEITLTRAEGGGEFAIAVGGDFNMFGQGFIWGQSEAASTNCYEDVAIGSGAIVSQSGHIRRAYDETNGYWTTSANGDQYRPQTVSIPYFTNFDPAAQAYPVGETAVHTIVPGDVGWHGMSSIDPRRWTLPAQISISGGALVAGIRFHVATGSSQIFSNATGAEVQTARDSIYLALVGSWITSIDLVVTNTSSGTSTSQDVGNFQFEGTVL